MCPSYLATRDEKDSTRGRARVLQEMVNGGAGHRRLAVRPRCTRRSTCACPARAARRDCPTGVDMATYKAEVLHQRYRRRLRPRSHYALGRLPRWARLGQPVAPGWPTAVLRLGAGAAARQGGRRHRPAPRRCRRSRRRPFRRVGRAGARRPPADGRDGGAVGGLVHRPLRPGRRPRRGRGAGGGRLPGRRGHRRRRLLRADLGHHRPARRGARAILARTVDALAPVRRRRHPGRRAGAVLPGDAAPRRRRAAPTTRGPPRSRPGCARWPSCWPALPGWTPPDLTGTTVVAQPHCHHATRARLGRRRARCCARTGRDGHPGRRLLRAGRQLRRGAGPLRGVGRGRRARTCCRPCGPRAADAVVLADGFSCRTQLDDLAGVRALHLAELLGRRRRGPGSGSVGSPASQARRRHGARGRTRTAPRSARFDRVPASR